MLKLYVTESVFCPPALLWWDTTTSAEIKRLLCWGPRATKASLLTAQGIGLCALPAAKDSNFRFPRLFPRHPPHPYPTQPECPLPVQYTRHKKWVKRVATYGWMIYAFCPDMIFVIHVEHPRTKCVYPPAIRSAFCVDNTRGTGAYSVCYDTVFLNIRLFPRATRSTSVVVAASHTEGSLLSLSTVSFWPQQWDVSCCAAHYLQTTHQQASPGCNGTAWLIIIIM